jgi:HK97 family phage major capsid protein
VQEGSTITDSRPTFGQLALRLHKLATLVALTSELKQDAGGALEAYVNKVFASEIAFETNKSIYRGTGSGQPLGILNAPASITVAKETGQAAATILTENIQKMWARRFALGPTGQYVWLVNQDVGPQLNTMTIGVGTGGQVTYLPPGGLSSAPYGTLMGAPVMEIEWASTLGTVGDIALVDLSQYVTINNGGPMTLNSLHVYFTSDQEAIRTTWRIDGQPWWASALTPYQGTNTQSPFVFLATRA